jgi:hypothetical protein
MAGDEIYKAIVWKGTGRPVPLKFPDPIDALTTAVAYLRDEYCVRLSDSTCRELQARGPLSVLDHKPAPQPQFSYMPPPAAGGNASG